MAAHPDNVHQLSTVPETFDADKIRALHQRVRAIIDADSYSQIRVAREAGMSSTTLSLFLSDTYTGDNQKVALKLSNWLTTYDEQESFDQLPAEPRWIETPTSARILAALKYARMASDIVLVVGIAGAGKSKAIAHYAAVSPHVWHVELSAGTGNLRGAMEEIAAAVGIRDCPRSVPAIQRAIAAKVRGTNGLLVVDEAQHASVRTLDQVRWFNDKCEIGIAFAGNDRVHTQFSFSERGRQLDRLYSRIGKKVVLNKAAPGDVIAVLEAWGIKDAACAEIAGMVAGRRGALRSLTKVLRLAATNATAKGGATITAKAMRAAAAELEVLE